MEAVGDPAPPSLCSSERLVANPEWAHLERVLVTSLQSSYALFRGGMSSAGIVYSTTSATGIYGLDSTAARSAIFSIWFLMED